MSTDVKGLDGKTLFDEYIFKVKQIHFDECGDRFSTYDMRKDMYPYRIEIYHRLNQLQKMMELIEQSATYYLTKRDLLEVLENG